MILLLAGAASSKTLLSLSSVDIIVVGLYFVRVFGIGLYLKRFTETGEVVWPAVT